MQHKDAIIEIQRQIFIQSGLRTDAHYKEDYGVLFVREGDMLAPHNVIHAVDELELEFIGKTVGRMTF